MNKSEFYRISYPNLEHPLLTQKIELKIKYYFLLKKYVNKFTSLFNLSDDVNYRLETFGDIIFANDSFSYIQDYSFESMFKTVNKTRFKPFKFFSYRYLFFFDSLFIIALGNKNIGIRICEEYKSCVKKKYHKYYDELVKIMYLEENNFLIKKPFSFMHKENRIFSKNMITKEMIDCWNLACEYLKTEEKKVVFTATMSAGKSTLINSIIGNELSSSKKAACTSTIITFCSSLFNNNIFKVINEKGLNKSFRLEEIKKITKNYTEPVYIVGEFLSPIKNLKVALVDTPGINSSQNPEHKEITRMELKRELINTIVYVIPVECYGSKDDYEHLKYIVENVEYKNIIFVINMIDNCDFEDDSVDEILSDIREHLIDIGYKDPYICPISAKAGLIIKQNITGIPQSENDKYYLKNYIRLFTRKELELKKYYCNVNCESLNYISGNYDEETFEAYLNTGLPEIEKILQGILTEE